jgi:rRNA maturation protein Nop10
MRHAINVRAQYDYCYIMLAGGGHSQAPAPPGFSAKGGFSRFRQNQSHSEGF